MSSDDFTVFLSPDGDGLSRDSLLRTAAARFTGRDASRWTCVREEGKKPRFSQAPEVCFSVSHSGGYWACSFGHAPVGFDLQRWEPCRTAALARRFFHPGEAVWLEERGGSEADFFFLWTAKESYLKYTGDGMVKGLDWFNVLAPLPGGAQLRHISGPDGYSLCLCAASVGRVSVVRL